MTAGSWKHTTVASPAQVHMQAHRGRNKMGWNAKATVMDQELLVRVSMGEGTVCRACFSAEVSKLAARGP